MEKYNYIQSIIYFKYLNKTYIYNIDKYYFENFSKNFNKLKLDMFDIYGDNDIKNLYVIFNNDFDNKIYIPQNFNTFNNIEFLNFLKINPKNINDNEFNIINDVIFNLN